MDVLDVIYICYKYWYEQFIENDPHDPDINADYQTKVPLTSHLYH